MVPLFLNNACPEGSLGILYHKPARRYKMGDEIRVAIQATCYCSLVVPNVGEIAEI